MRNASPPAWTPALVAVLLVLQACATWPALRTEPTSLPTDLPLPEFILGRWRSTAAYGAGGSEWPYSFEIWFEDQDTLKILWFNEDGQFLDGDTVEYSFTTPDSITIDSRRAADKETWALKREGQSLLIDRTRVYIVLERLER